MSAWKDLIPAYKTSKIDADGLKAVTLAQWILESGRGKSELARKHLNFGGLKYEARMKDHAEPVDFTGSDGVATAYCKFGSVGAFIEGYWHFIESGPYGGWKKHKNDPAGYLRHIQQGGYAEDEAYIGKVLSLFPEADKLLAGDAQADDESGAEEPMVQPSDNAVSKRLAVLVGHNSASKGASAGSPINRVEFDYNKEVAQAMKAEAAHYSVVVEVFYRPAGVPYSQEIQLAYDKIRAWDPHATLELHFNSFDSPDAKGTEVWHRAGNNAGRGLATAVNASLLGALKLNNRGVKAGSPGDRGYASLNAMPSAAMALTEPFFGSNAGDCLAAATLGQAGLARTYLRGARDFLSGA